MPCGWTRPRVSTPGSNVQEMEGVDGKHAATPQASVPSVYKVQYKGRMARDYYLTQ